MRATQYPAKTAIVLSARDYARADAVAIAENVTRASAIRTLLTAALDAYETERGPLDLNSGAAVPSRDAFNFTIAPLDRLASANDGGSFSPRRE